jgi:hypothetical protein
MNKGIPVSTSAEENEKEYQEVKKDMDINKSENYKTTLEFYLNLHFSPISKTYSFISIKIVI